VEPQLAAFWTRWFSVVVPLGAGLALLAYGVYVRRGYSKQYYLRKRKGLLAPGVYHALPLIGVVLCLLGVTGLFADVEARQRLLIFLVTPAVLASLVVGLAQPSWLKPSWLSRLQSKHPDIYPFLREVAREEVGEDQQKAAEWVKAMGSTEGQDGWVARVRKRRRWPRRELHAAEGPSIKVPRRFRRLMARVQQLPPSSGSLEEQIEIYEDILSQLRKEEASAFWAAVQNKLGIAYAARRRGSRAENLEKAIAAYEVALAVTQKRTLLVDSAMIQNNLGAAYRRRIRGEKADNLERAISAYEAALEVFTREEYPLHWAGTQSSLGFAYLQRIRGERAENLGKAIAAYEKSLQVYTEEEYPEERAKQRERLEEARQALEQG
jgi:tetratricopeptide (TPR) repeat protein